MKFNIRRCITYFDVSVEIERTKIELGLMGEAERAELAKTLRDAADDLCPEDVPYAELEFAWNREQEASQ